MQTYLSDYEKTSFNTYKIFNMNFKHKVVNFLNLKEISTVVCEQLGYSATCIATSVIGQIHSHRTLSQLVGGSGCVLSGMYLIYKSQIPQKYFQIFRRCALSIEAKSERDRIENVSCFALGLVASLYGFYTTYLGILEAFQTIESQPPLYVYSRAKSEMDEEISSMIRLIPNHQGEKIKEQLLACSFSKQTVKEALKGGPIQIILLDPDSTPNLHLSQAPALWDSTERTIFINNKLSKEAQVIHGFFEFINASQQKKFQIIQSKVALGELNAWEYAKESERVEFKTSKIHCEGLKECLSQWSTNPFFRKNIFQNCERIKLKNFEETWEEMKNDEHTKLYLNHWITYFRDDYCQRHRNDKVYC